MPPEYLDWNTSQKHAYRMTYPAFNRFVKYLHRDMLKERDPSESWEAFGERCRQAVAAWEPTEIPEPQSRTLALGRIRNRLRLTAHELAIELAAKTGWECWYCLEPMTLDSITVDHVVPLCRGGGRGRDNVVPACKRCNNWKHNRTPEEWFAEVPPHKALGPIKRQTITQWLKEQELIRRQIESRWLVSAE